MNGRATQTDLRSEKKNIAATGEPRVQARVHLANVPPLPYLFPIMVNHGQKKERRREARRGEVDGVGCGFEWRLCSCRTGDRRTEEREPAGKGGAPMALQSAGDDGAARSPDATVGDGSRRGAGDDVCGAATGPTAVPPTARQLSAPCASSCCCAPAPKAAVVAGGRRGRWRQPEEIQSTMGR